MEPHVNKIEFRTRKIERKILQRLASVGQARIAEQLGINESTVSRWKDSEIERQAKFLALLDLSVVHKDIVDYDKQSLEAIFTLARQHLNQLDSVEHFAREEDE